MMKTRYFIFLFIALISCEKEKNEKIDATRPQKIIQYEDMDHDTILFEYNGLLVNKKHETNRDVSVQYSEGLISNELFTFKGDIRPYLKMEYEYDEQDRIIKLSYNVNKGWKWNEWNEPNSDEFRPSADYYYEYEGNKIIKEYYYDYDTEDTLHYAELEFDSNRNLISKIEYTPYQGKYYKIKEYYYLYDNKNHYYKEINYPLYGSFHSVNNNIIQEHLISYSLSWSSQTGSVEINLSSDKTINYDYEYNLNDFPTICINEENDTILQIIYMDE